MVLEVREPAVGREWTRLYVVPGVPLLPNFSIVRRRVGVPIARVVTVWEDCSGQLMVFRPAPLLYILILVIWTG